MDVVDLNRETRSGLPSSTNGAMSRSRSTASSLGAMVVQSALWRHRGADEPRFKTGVAMYPRCHRATLYAPMLVIIGGADDWTPSSSCAVYNGDENVELHIYDGI